MILKKVYEQEEILVPSDVEAVEFSTFAAPRLLVDNLVIFPKVARIPDAMLRCIDLQHPILVKYLTSIDANGSVGVLPLKGAVGSSKVVKLTKKKKQAEKPQHVMEEVSKEIIPLKIGILKRTKKPTKRPHDSLFMPSI